MKKKINYFLISVALILLLTLFYVLAGPFMSLYGIKAGIEENNQEKLEQFVDFPELRKNIKTKVRKQIMDSLGFDLSDSENMLARFAVRFTDQMIDLGVDSAISPSGLSLMMTGNDLNDVMLGSKNTQDVKKDKKDFLELLEENKFHFTNDHEFVFIFINRENTETSYGGKTQLVFYRKGLSWKLSDVIFDAN